MVVTVTPRQLLTGAIGVSLLLFGSHTVAVLIVDAAGGDPTRDVAGLLNLGLDSAAPTWFAAALLAGCAILALVAADRSAQIGSGNRRHWIGLAVVCLAMSVDEVATAHEKLNAVGRRLVGGDGIFFYSWVVIGAIAVTAFVIAYWPFLLRLPARTRWLLIGSGVCFVGGALVLEGLNGALHDEIGGRNALTTRYWLQTGVEELFEMLGVSLLLYCLADYIADGDRRISLAISAPSVPASSHAATDDPAAAR